MAGEVSEDPTRGYTRLEPVRVRGTDPPENIAPAGPSGEHDFFSERLALFARIACLASSGFLVMRVVLNALANRDPTRTAPFDPFPFFHLAATAVLFLIWMLAGSRSVSDRGLRYQGSEPPPGQRPRARGPARRV